MREVTVPIEHQGQAHEVRAEVEKFGVGDYQIDWCDKAAVEDLGLTHFALGQLRRLCAEAFEVLETERELAGIASLLDDSAHVTSHDRDHRAEEVPAA